VPGLIKTSWHPSPVPAGMTVGVLAHATMVLTAPPLPSATRAWRSTECWLSAVRAPGDGQRETPPLRSRKADQIGSVKEEEFWGPSCHHNCPEAELTQRNQNELVGAGVAVKRRNLLHWPCVPT
jgi:hypothetical protein